MTRQKLLDEYWNEELRTEISSCVVFRKEKMLRDTCPECESYPICKKVFEMEQEEKEI